MYFCLQRINISLDAIVMFFFDNGFINLSIDKIRQNQMFVQPPSHFSSERTFSTRAFFANKDALNNCLPIKPLKRGLKTIIKCYY